MKLKSSSAPPINLASEPFRRERADTALYAGIAGLLFVSLLALTGFILFERSQASDIRKKIEHQDAELRLIRTQQSRYTAVLSRPENAGTFANSVFLNQVIARRAVSWTGVFRDLGTVMPSNVRLLAVRLPQIDADDPKSLNRVQLDMIVGTTQPEAVISLFRNLQKSEVFGAASFTSQTPPAQNDPLYKYRITVPYEQKL